MGSTVQVLEESFRLLLKQPRFFVPKIFSTLTASLFIVYLISSPAALAAMEPLRLVSVMLGSLFLLSILGVYSSMMLSSMVKTSDPSLLNAFRDVFGKSLNVLKASFATILVGLTVSFVFTGGYWLYLATGSVWYLIFSGVLFLSAVLVISYYGYFLPVTLLVEKNFRKAFGSSVRGSSENRRVVISLLIFSLFLIMVAFSSAGLLEKLGYFGFVAGRLVSSIANTYIFTVSPTYYFEESGS